MPDNAPLAHTVFFTLTDGSQENIDRLVAGCNEYLSGHDGVTHFSVGTLVHELQREVNDRDFHVTLNVFFESKAAHDTYQTHPRHLAFIEQHKDMWAQVRVFDSYLDGASLRA